MTLSGYNLTRDKAKEVKKSPLQKSLLTSNFVKEAIAHLLSKNILRKFATKTNTRIISMTICNVS
ncbi:hypothetical protein [Okeania sp.]|uniref:hypothetical protein n=1 Tax=Okeania sp. TaxID=3100323 RepID=UPI002B4AC97D|nr:hypothetical protein [Okeania sp.]MEB3342375.1 hypothetical protein [Okeania sp.]